MRRLLVLIVVLGAMTTVVVVSRLLPPRPAAVSSPPTPEYVEGADPEATRLFERGLAAVNAAPTDSRPRVELGMMFQANAMLDRARQCYEQATQLDETNDVAWYFLATAHRHLGEMEPALTALRRAVAGDAHAAAHATLGDWLLDMNDIVGAESAYRSALAVDPGWVPARVGLARAALGRDAPAEARTILEALLRERADPGAQALRVLAAAARRTGDLDLAAAMSERSMVATARWRDPVYLLLDQYRIGVPIELERARALVSQGRFDEALAGLYTLEARFPDAGSIPNGIGIALARAGRLEEALVAFERALARHEPFAEAHYNWAMISIMLADRGEAPVPAAAREHLLRALEVDPDYEPAVALQAELERRRVFTAPSPPPGAGG